MADAWGNSRFTFKAVLLLFYNIWPWFNKMTSQSNTLT